MNEDLGNIIGKIMSTPGFGNLVNELKTSGALSEVGGDAKVSADPADLPSPDAMAEKLPALLAALGNGNGGKKSPEGEQIEKAVSALKKMDSKNCEKLLCALKPYLNKERGEVIDKAMSVMKITDLLGTVSDLTGGDGGAGKE